MNVLIGCEESGKVRDAFAALGHNAWSCDLMPTRSPKGPSKHFEADIKAAIEGADVGWDIIILHPDCTALTVAGNRWYGKGMPKHQQRLDAIEWTVDLWGLAKRSARIGCALENPVSVIFKHLNAPVQYIQPYQFGHMEQKKTGLALHNLPPLTPSNNVYDEMMKLPKRERERVFYMPPGKNRARDRSETYTGIAEAMADCWGNLSNWYINSTERMK